MASTSDSQKVAENLRDVCAEIDQLTKVLAVTPKDSEQYVPTARRLALLIQQSVGVHPPALGAQFLHAGLPGVGTGAELPVPAAPAMRVSEDVITMQASALAYPKSWARAQESARKPGCLQPYLGGRPCGFVSLLPVSLVDPALAKAKQLFLDAINPARDGAPLSQEECVAVMDLLVMANSFADGNDEAFRREAATPILDRVLGQHLLRLRYMVSDGLILHNPAKNMLPLLILKVKDEMGSSGDPYFQGQACYQKALLLNAEEQPPDSHVVRTSACPCLLLELVGPLLRVSALASVQDVQVICEPLTPFLHLLDVRASDPLHMLRLGLVLRALREAVDHLRGVYSSRLNEASSTLQAQGDEGAQQAKKQRTDLGAAVRREPNLVLPHPLRNGYVSGERTYARVEQLAFGGRQLPLYRCTADDGSSVLVKYVFGRSYGEEVHRAWAKEGLAPELHSVTSVASSGSGVQVQQVVMEDLRESSGWCNFALLPADTRQQFAPAVKQALAAAHNVAVGNGKGVHADARAANVMVLMQEVSGTVSASGHPVRFVDFDWAGVTTPSDALEQRRVRLPPFSRKRCGKGSGDEVTQEYDVQLWEATWQREGLKGYEAEDN